MWKIAPYNIAGGFDHEWGWRGAVEICLDRRNISGITLKNIRIVNSLSNGLSVVAKNADGKTGVLTNSSIQNLTVSNYGIGIKDKHGVYIAKEAHGGVTVQNSAIIEIDNESADFTIQH